MICKERKTLPVDWVLRGVRSPVVRAVQLVLWVEAQSLGFGAPLVQVSQEAIATAAAISPATCKRVIRRLREDGFLLEVETARRGAPPVYRLTIPAHKST